MSGKENNQSPPSAAPGMAVFLCFWLLFSFCCISRTAALAQDNIDSTLEYFRRLDLDHLTIDELHLRFGNQSDAIAIRAIATRLIGEYVIQFLAGGPSNPDFGWDASKMQRLADTVPDLTSQAFRLAILAARVQSGEKDFLAWRNQLSGGQSQVELAREMELVFRSIQVELENLDVSQQAGAGSEPDQGQLRFRAVLLGAEVSMRLLVLEPNNNSAAQTAIAWLQQILRLDSDEKISTRQLEAMAPESDWQIRALESLAICRLRTETGDVSGIISVIERGGNYADNMVAKIRVLAGAAQFEAIERLLTDITQTPQQRSAIMTGDPSRIWIEAVRAGRQTPHELSNLRQAIIWLAVCELATIDVRILHRSLQKWSPTEIPPPPDEFSKYWIAAARGLGQILLREQLDSTRLKNQLPSYLNPHPQPGTNELQVDSKKALADLGNQLEKGLPLLDGVERPEYRAAFLLTVAEVDFRMGNWQDVVAEARRVLDIGAEVGHGQAARAAGLLLQSRVQLSKKDPSQQLLLRKEASEMTDRFPNQTVGQMAKLQIMIVENRQRSAEQAIEFWQQYRKQSPENEVARIELLTRLLEIASETINNLRQERFSQSIELVRTIMNSKTDSLATKIWATTNLVNAARGDGTLFSTSESASLLEQLEFLASDPGNSVEESGEAFFATMRLAKMAGNERVRKNAMSWIIDHPQSGPWFAAALFERAKELESNWESAGPESDEFQSLLETYEAIFDNAGADVDAIRQDPNMRVVASRMAGMYVRQGKNALAEKLFELILQVYPNDRDILLAAARVNVASGDLQKATDRWRRLSRFFPAGSDLWRESRYNLYKCFLENSPETAETVRKQTFELDPEMPDDWRRRY